MLSRFNKTLAAGLLVMAASLLPTTASAQNRMRTFTVVNDSDVRIEQMYVAYNDSRYWGSDRLGSELPELPHRFGGGARLVRREAGGPGWG